MTEAERTDHTPHEKIFVARAAPAESDALMATVEALQNAALRSDHSRIRALLQEFLDGSSLGVEHAKQLH